MIAYIDNSTTPLVKKYRMHTAPFPRNYKVVKVQKHSNKNIKLRPNIAYKGEGHPRSILFNQRPCVFAASKLSQHQRLSLSGETSTPAPKRIHEVKFWRLYLFLMLNMNIVCLSKSTRIKPTCHVRPLSKPQSRRRNANEHYLIASRSHNDILSVLGKRQGPTSPLPESRHIS